MMTEQKGKGYQGIRAVETFEYENTRSDLKCCDYRKKCQAAAKYTRDPRGILGKVTLDEFTDEPEFQ